MTATFARTPVARQNCQVSTELRSPEGKQILQKTQKADEIWQDLIRHLKMDGRKRAVQTHSFSVRVRYKFMGRGKPLPYPIDEE
jgi:hypothetical protein